jgi:hypothetical protein
MSCLTGSFLGFSHRLKLHLRRRIPQVRFLFSLQKCGSLKSEYFYWWYVSHNIGRIKLSLDDGFSVAILCFTPIEKEYPLLGIDSGLWCLLLQPKDTSFALVRRRGTCNQTKMKVLIS